MKRRELFKLIGGGMIAWPLVKSEARNISDHGRKIGVLSAAPLGNGVHLYDAFEQGLRDQGWHPGTDLLIQFRSADGYIDRLPGIAAALAESGVEVIVAVSGPETRAALAATSGIPIVFITHGDPVGAGDVKSLAHPGGMVTGFSQMHPELSRKQLEIFKECLPALSRVAVLWNSANPLKANDWNELNPAAQALGLYLESHEVQAPTGLEAAFTKIEARQPDGILVLGDPLTTTLRAQIADFALKLRLPAMCPFRLFVDAGGLISYGADLNDFFRRAASYVDKILNGAKPGDLPVEQPIKFELVINLKTAKTLNLALPPELLARANVVIE